MALRIRLLRKSGKIFLTFTKASRITAVIEVGINLVDYVRLTVEHHIHNRAARGCGKNRIILMSVFVTIRVAWIVDVHPTITQLNA